MSPPGEYRASSPAIPGSKVGRLNTGSAIQPRCGRFRSQPRSGADGRIKFETVILPSYPRTCLKIWTNDGRYRAMSEFHCGRFWKVTSWLLP